MNKIIVHCTSDSNELPGYSSELASGADIRANNEEPITMAPGKRELIPTGIYLQIPAGFEAQVRPRSGLAIKHGVMVLNTPGTIDADYRGEVKIILGNLGEKEFVVNKSDRIAQLVFAPVYQAEFVLQKELEETVRGSGGFGSTGIS